MRHKAIYRRLTALDRRLADGGMSVDRRRALWTALDEDPLFEHAGSSPAVNAMRNDLLECRRIRSVAFEEDTVWVASSVYEALLAILFLVPSGDDFVFRGHLNADWRLVPSFFRMTPRVSLHLHARFVYGAYRWAEREVGHELDLTPFGAEAAAQHYGAGTTLLDVTESLRIAAYFATTPLRQGDQQAEYGSIHVFEVAKLEKQGFPILRGRDLPAELGRIHQTRGSFIAGIERDYSAPAEPVRNAGDIVAWMNESAHVISELGEAGLRIHAELLAGGEALLSGVRFRQTGDSFEDEAWGVTRREIGRMPDPPANI